MRSDPVVRKDPRTGRPLPRSAMHTVPRLRWQGIRSGFALTVAVLAAGCFLWIWGWMFLATFRHLMEN